MMRPAAEAIGAMAFALAVAVTAGGALPPPAGDAVRDARAEAMRAAAAGLDRLGERLDAALDRAARRLAGD